MSSRNHVRTKGRRGGGYYNIMEHFPHFVPPISFDFSKRVTWWPMVAAVYAKLIPAGPLPTTPILSLLSGGTESGSIDISVSWQALREKSVTAL